MPPKAKKEFFKNQVSLLTAIITATSLIFVALITGLFNSSSKSNEKPISIHPVFNNNVQPQSTTPPIANITESRKPSIGKPDQKKATLDTSTHPKVDTSPKSQFDLRGSQLSGNIQLGNNNIQYIGTDPILTPPILQNILSEVNKVQTEHKKGNAVIVTLAEGSNGTKAMNQLKNFLKDNGHEVLYGTIMGEPPFDGIRVFPHTANSVRILIGNLK
jgi:hypothetical protein